MRMPTIAAIGFLLVLATAACGGSGASPAEASGPAGEASAPADGGTTAACEVVEEPGTVQAEAAGFAFTPSPVVATVGSAVTWTNGDSAPHTVTLDDGSCDTGQFGQGESGTIQFNAPGTYAYHCAIHPNMKGTVDVS